MEIVIRDNPLRAPLFRSNKATWAEIRDQSGAAVFVVIFPPGGSTFITVTKNDPEFDQMLREFGIKPIDPPSGA